LSSGNAGFFSGYAPMLAGLGGGREGEERIATGVPATPGPFQLGLSYDDGLVPVLASQRVLAAVPVPAGGA
jgi:hypothetical protein